LTIVALIYGVFRCFNV